MVVVMVPFMAGGGMPVRWAAATEAVRKVRRFRICILPVWFRLGLFLLLLPRVSSCVLLLYVCMYVCMSTMSVVRTGETREVD